MAGSRTPGADGAHTGAASLDDGTGARARMPGGGTVGHAAHQALAPRERVAAGEAASQETRIDAQGVLKNAKVHAQLASTIERGRMELVRGLVVHQTDSATARSTLDSYRSANANGAHFLIDKDGTVYQTASLYQRTWHVGKLKARCLVEQTCSPAEIKAYKRFDPAGMNARESAKSVPARYPSNVDSVGIELVGRALPLNPLQPAGSVAYETVTEAQNKSLKWLVAELQRLLAVPMTEVFRHPEVSWKNPTEAQSANWR